jgi:hypothetical protein
VIELSVDQQRDAMKAVARAMAAESDGKALKRDLAKRLRSIMDPLKVQVTQRLMQIPTTGHEGESLRQAVKRQVRAATRFSGRNTGVSLTQRARSMPRSFQYAGRALNRPEGWQPISLGGATLHQEARPVEWFDEPTSRSAEKAKREVTEALADMARRIADRSKM